jgi:hypothetical protein
MDHTGFKSSQTTNEDSMHASPGNYVVLQVPRDSAKPIEKGLWARIDHTEESYDHVYLRIKFPPA